MTIDRARIRVMNTMFNIRYAIMNECEAAHETRPTPRPGCRPTRTKTASRIPGGPTLRE